jgi:hypothetical protein
MFGHTLIFGITYIEPNISQHTHKKFLFYFAKLLANYAKAI